MDRLSSFHFGLPAFWICVAALEGFVLFLQVCRLSCCNFTHVEWEQAPWKQQHRVSENKHGGVEEQGNLNGVFWICLYCKQLWGAVTQAQPLCRCQGKPTFPLICVGLLTVLGCFLWVCVGINDDVESCTFWISDCFWKSCIFWSTYSHRRLWIMSLFLN